MTTFDPVEALNWIAYSDDGLTLVAPDVGTIERPLPLHPLSELGLDGVDRAFAWSPDGRQIAFLYTTLEPEVCARGYLMLADLQAGTVRPLLDAPGHYGPPVWSPDGTHLAFTDGTATLRLLEIDTGETVEVSHEAEPGVAPVWIDADQLLYARTLTPDTEIVLYLLGESESETLTDVQGKVTAWAVAAEANRLAYYVYPFNSPSGHLFVGSLEPFAVQEVLVDARERLQWSPDGEFLLARGGLAGIFLLAATDPNEMMQLPATGVLGDQAWSPDSQRVVLLTGPEGRLPTLSIYDIESGTPVHLSHVAQPPYALAWGP